MPTTLNVKPGNEVENICVRVETVQILASRRNRCTPLHPTALQGRRDTHRHDAVGNGLLEGILHRFLQLGQQHGSDLFNAERLLLLHVHHLRFATQKRRTGQARVQTRTKIQSAAKIEAVLKQASNCWRNFLWPQLETIFKKCENLLQNRRY